MQILRWIHHVQNDSEVIFMKLFNRLLRLWKDVLVEHKRTMSRVPAGGAESCSQKDHRVAGETLLAKGLRLLQNGFPALKSGVRLLISQSPHRRQMRIPADLSPLPHQLGRRISCDQKYILSARHIARPKDSK